MNTTFKRDVEKKDLLTVNVDTLAGMLDCGRATAAKIGSDAGARVQVGRRVLYKVTVVEKYLDAMAGE